MDFVEQLLKALRRETERLGPWDDSALEYRPDEATGASEAADE
jgi:hypothetical protein